MVELRFRQDRSGGGACAAIDSGDNDILSPDIRSAKSDSGVRAMEVDVDQTLLLTAINKLNQREREVITMRFGLNGAADMTQKEVADLMGLSQSCISRLEKKIILLLCREMSPIL